MARSIDRYLYRQLLAPTLAATAALSVLALLSQALSFLSLVMAQREGTWLLIRLVLLASPQLVVLVLPIAILVATLATANRLHRENEIAVCFASGMSRWQVLAPALRLGVGAAVFSLAVSLWVQPLCYRALRETLHAARTDLASTMIRPGQFTHPAPGVTVYAQSIDESGAIHNLFIDRRLATGREAAITARTGRVRPNGAAPLLLLAHGATLDYAPSGVLSLLSFDNYVLDLRALLPARPSFRYKPSDLYLHELIFPASTDRADVADRGRLLAEANARIAAPLYDIAFGALAIVAVIGGPFSRMGYGARIAVSAAVALLVRIAGLGAEALSVRTPEAGLLQYAIPAGAAAACIWLMLRRTAPRSAALLPGGRAALPRAASAG